MTIMELDVMTVTGLIASVALLAGFALLTLGKLTAEHYTYQWLNAIGAGFLAYSAFVTEPINMGVFLTEVIWSLIGVYGIFKIWRKRRVRLHRHQALQRRPLRHRVRLGRRRPLRHLAGLPHLPAPQRRADGRGGPRRTPRPDRPG